MDAPIFYTFMETPLGQLQISGNESEILQITFLEETDSIKEGSLENEITLKCKQQLVEYFERKRKIFDFRLNPQGTPFQQQVWQTLQTISFGKTTSYLDLSKKINNVKAIRAVGGANGANPIAIVIPCHRVIGHNGELTGYASGLWRKKWLLDFEGGQGSLF